MDNKALLIGGELVFTDDVMSVESPWTREPVGECCRAGPAEVQKALDTAYAGAQTMRQLRSYQRADILHRVADGLVERREDFARMIAMEGGKPILEARAEAVRAESTFRLAAETARSWGGELLPLDITAAGGDRVALVRRFPVGLVTGISPFNFPLNLVAHKIAPAVAAGCSINLKPASATPLTALMLGELLLEAGIPPGGCNVVPVSSSLAGPLLEDPRVKAVTFTGSVAVGWELMRRAVGKRVCLELGGNAAAIVEPDCDLEHALNRILVGGYAHTGQICISVQHVLVHRELFDEFLTRFVPMVEGLKMGDPLDEETRVAAIIDEEEARRVEEWVDEAVAAGGRLLCGGGRDGNRIPPAVLVEVPDHCRISCEEAFAPVTLVAPYDRFEQALERINSWKFGLQTGVFTHDVGRAMMAYNRLDVGGVIIDDIPTFRVDNYPYGGVKQSGFGREGIRYAMEELSELKTLVLPAPR